MQVQFKSKGNSLRCCLTKIFRLIKNLRVYMNMIKCSALMLFDMLACHVWAHQHKNFDTLYKHY